MGIGRQSFRLDMFDMQASRDKSFAEAATAAQATDKIRLGSLIAGVVTRAG
jgi:hypothetical protein